MILTYLGKKGVLDEVRLSSLSVKKVRKKKGGPKYALTFTLPPTRGFVTIETSHFSIINEAK